MNRCVFDTLGFDNVTFHRLSADFYFFNSCITILLHLQFLLLVPLLQNL